MATILEKYVNVNDAAEIIGCTRGRVRQLLLAGKLAGEKVSALAWLVERKAVEQYRDREYTTGRPRKNKNRY